MVVAQRLGLIYLQPPCLSPFISVHQASMYIYRYHRYSCRRSTYFRMQSMWRLLAYYTFQYPISPFSTTQRTEMSGQTPPESSKAPEDELSIVPDWTGEENNRLLELRNAHPDISWESLKEVCGLLLMLVLAAFSTLILMGCSSMP